MVDHPVEGFWTITGTICAAAAALLALPSAISIVSDLIPGGRRDQQLVLDALPSPPFRAFNADPTTYNDQLKFALEYSLEGNQLEERLSMSFIRMRRALQALGRSERISTFMTPGDLDDSGTESIPMSFKERFPILIERSKDEIQEAH
jgi:hypothetical protein